MEKRKPWQLILILTVVLLTMVNILPTIFYYSNPLKQEVGEEQAQDVASSIVQRVQQLEVDTLDWLNTYTKYLGLSASSIDMVPENPGLIQVTFNNGREAGIFRSMLNEAGGLIPFAPAQLEISSQTTADPEKTVLIERRVSVRLDTEDAKRLFFFSKKWDERGEVTDSYRKVVNERLREILLELGGTSPEARRLSYIAQQPNSSGEPETLLALAKQLVEMSRALGEDSPVMQRYYGSFSQSAENGQQLVDVFSTRLSTLKSSTEAQLKRLNKAVSEKKELDEEGGFVDADQVQLLDLTTRQVEILTQAVQLLESRQALFKRNLPILTQETIDKLLLQAIETSQKTGSMEVVSLGDLNPWFASIFIDWDNDRLLIALHDDVEALRSREEKTETDRLVKERVSQAIFNEVARLSRNTDEQLAPEGQGFALTLNSLTSSSSVLVLDLGALAKRQSEQILSRLQQVWYPKHPDLLRENFPIWSYSEYQALPLQQQNLGAYVYAPSMDESGEEAPEGFRNGSLYVVAKGLYHIIDKYQEVADSEESEKLLEDIQELQGLVAQGRVIAYRGDRYGMDSSFKNDLIIELPDFAVNFLSATREDFTVLGSKRYAVLEFTNNEQRLHATNRIENQVQEDLLKWKDQHNTALVDLDQTARFRVPPPAKNAYWENLKLSTRKYFRGDENRIIQWGQDLQGGKTVRIGLRDQNNQPVTSEEDLKQAVNELYTRVNKMGVSERTIRIENQKIVLEFPGSQALSAAELVQGSTMTFHIVNEKFSVYNSQVGTAVNQFLQNVWNEAVVTNRTDAESVKLIAWEHLGGNEEEGQLYPLSEEARILKESGLTLAHPIDTPATPAFNDRLSSIAIIRGDDPTDWRQNHPLLIVFHNYALEGSSLSEVQSGYDPSRGHMLYFNVGGSYASKEGRSGNPRDDFYAWTSQYNKTRVAGTSKEELSRGEGWRMAIVLNGLVISSPTLSDALRDGGSIHGNFSQREVNRLVADLKAGSLSFTPKILSEMNVSPDLGREERTKGIAASIMGLVFVVCAMIMYYRFAGVIASLAVTFNLLIMWGVLQNLGAALTLPGLAGIILTVGMAVDANVLVFERIREELAVSGRLAVAVAAGYRKAFSAIIDSNLTTILAALILIQFDAGPIKGFAITLIIGIISSMFTALFMTRYFFAGWVAKAKGKTLNMRDWIGKTQIDFLGKAKAMACVSLVVALVGAGMFWSQRHTMFGMEFTGGYSLVLELEERESEDTAYRVVAEEALSEAGAVSTDFQVKRLNKPNQLRFQFGQGMEQAGRPFEGMPETQEADQLEYAYQKNPRINWVIETLEKAGLEVKVYQLESLEQNWSVMSGQFSEVMRNNALMALGLAMVCILLYITFRFEFKYAIAAIVALSHDLIITLALMSVFHKLGLPVQIDLEVIGALMTIIGYSLNDTIIIFDRIREDVRLMRKHSFVDVVAHALNVTLSRTLMTSGTTLLVLLTLVLFGGSGIFAFALVMFVGVIVGTLSSLFIASPVMIYFHEREQAKLAQNTRLTKA